MEARSSPRILILADDLSGAADCAIACRRRGLDAEVALGPWYEPSGASIFAVDADTRGLNAADAAERMYELAASLKVEGCTVLFKKIDSTLRGHLRVELAAVLDARRARIAHPIAVVAPAFPANGRTTLEGVVHLHGRPLNESDLWRREEMSGEANIAQMLGDGLRCVHVEIGTLRGGVEASVVRGLDADVIVCDAASEDDLMAVARLAAALGERAIWVGSAGLAHCIPEAMGVVSLHAAEPDAYLPSSGPVLFVIGTAAARTRDQVRHLLSSSEIRSIVIPSRILLGEKQCEPWHRFATELVSAVENGDDVILLCDAEPGRESGRRAEVSVALAEMTAGLGEKVGTLVASGGETARKVLDRWGVRALMLQGELEAGVPISSANRIGSPALTVITKAGDFGQEDALLRCLKRVKERGR